VGRKLDASLSVEYTVNELINEATDIANLSRIFPGRHSDFSVTDELLIIHSRVESALLNCAPFPCCCPSLPVTQIVVGQK
jgi:FATC domain